MDTIRLSILIAKLCAIYGVSALIASPLYGLWLGIDYGICMAISGMLSIFIFPLAGSFSCSSEAQAMKNEEPNG